MKFLMSIIRYALMAVCIGCLGVLSGQEDSRQGTETIALVLGEKITEGAQIRSKILEKLLNQFSKDQGIKASSGEIEAYLLWSNGLLRGRLKALTSEAKLLRVNLKKSNLSEEDRVNLMSALDRKDKVIHMLEIQIDMPELTEEEKKRVIEFHRKLASETIIRGKINKLLYVKYLVSDKFDHLPLSGKAHGFRPFSVDS